MIVMKKVNTVSVSISLLKSYDNGFKFELEQANHLANAVLQSNNNTDNDVIEGFSFYESKRNLTPVIFQPL